MAMRAKITERLVQSLTQPAVIMDTRLFGFGVRRFASGRISFFVRKVCGGRDRRKVIGTYPDDLSVRSARTRASAILSSLAGQVENPLATPPMERVEFSKQLSRLEAMLSRLAPPEPATCPLTFEQVLLEVHDAYFAKKKERTRITYQRYIDSVLLPEFGELPMDQLTAERIEDWHANYKGKAGGRPTQPRKILMSILRLAKQRRIIRKVPAPELVEDWSSEIREAFDPETAERIDAYYTRRISSPDVHVSELAIWVGLHTAERAESLVSLAIDEVNFKTREVTKKRKGKKGKDVYTLVYNNEVIGVLRQLKPDSGRYFFPRPNYPGDHVQAQMVRRHFQRDCEANGWELPKGGKPCLHTLRHTLLTYLGNKGVAVPVIAALAGHRHVQTTMRYIHPNEKAAREATNHSSIGARRRKRQRRSQTRE